MTALLVILILVLLIVVHELGHFVAAKLSGVKVKEFGVGYPPRAYLLGKLGDTEYSLNWIPFGGFVRLFGDEGEGEKGRGSFLESARWKQALILFAGVAMNAFAGWALFSGAYMVGLPRPVASSGRGAELVVSEVVRGSPAESAGLRAGDTLLGITDDRGVELGELSPDAAREYVAVRGGRRLAIRYLREDAVSIATAIPANAVIPEAAGRPALGIALELLSTESLPLPQALAEGFRASTGALRSVFAGLWHMIESAWRGAPDIQNIIGPVGLVSLVGSAIRGGMGELLALSGFISINLAVINLIPIPALDGGRLAVVGVEALARRPVPSFLLRLLNALGIALVVLLMFVVTYHDVVRLLA